MLGWSLWKSLANFLNCGESPTHDENVTVTGLVGSLGTIGLMAAPDDRGAALLLGAAPPPTHAVAIIAMAPRAATVVPARRVAVRTLTRSPPVLWPGGPASDGRGPAPAHRRATTSGANRFAAGEHHA